MLNTPSSQAPFDLDQRIEAFEIAQQRADRVDIGDFLPGVGHPRYQEALRELIRLDLEFGWKRGDAVRLDDYRRRFPVIDDDPRTLREIAFEEYRQRLEHGEQPSAREYRLLYGVELEDSAQEKALPPTMVSPSAGASPALAPSARATNAPSLRAVASAAYCQFRREHPESGSDAIEAWAAAFPGDRMHAELLRDTHKTDPEAAHRLARSAIMMPQPGDRFLGFRLIDVLGSGAFATVFLAQQGELANRLVALKVSTQVMEESQTLAQLQHTNIVPIYSYHFIEPFQAVCMPYLGSSTLADVLRVAESRGGLPRSGKDLVSTLNDRKRSTAAKGTGEQRTNSDPYSPLVTLSPCHLVTLSPSPAVSSIALQHLEGRSYVDAVLWLAGQLADGLAHAHERGILHRDLKPANILLTDDGQPLLLDFNLSADVKAPATAAAIGGTLPYMAPEHLEAFGGGKRPVDARSDIYSFGVILYELLTLRSPFSLPSGPRHELLPRMIAEREQGAPALRSWNPLVPKTIESIVQHCLEPSPERRYQAARELQEDLERQEQQLPLKHAPEPMSERVRKWVRRHPRLMSGSSVAVLAAVLLLATIAALAGYERRASRLDAQRNLVSFCQEAAAVEHLLNAENTSGYVTEGIRKGENLADRYGLRTDRAWRDRRNVRLLDGDEQRQLNEEAGRLLILLSRAKMQQAQTRSADERDPLLRESDEYCARAETCFEPERLPGALRGQQAELKRLLGSDKAALRLKEEAANIGRRTTLDYYLAATEESQQGRNAAALKLLDEGLQHDATDFSLHFLKGVCFGRLDRHVEALGANDTCIALQPESPFPYFNRGLVRLKQKRYDKAKADFDAALRFASDSEQFLADAHVNRALALQGLERFAEALADLNQALEIGLPRSRLHFVRQRLYEKLGDKEAAKAAHEEGLRAEPHDELDWNARGLARLPGDPNAAVADFDKALERNPHYFPALQNKAFVLGFHLKRLEDAVKVLNEAVRCAPEDARPVAGRGVYLARLGQREAALSDAQTALQLDGAPANVYQVAGIYALTSKTNSDDKQTAFRLLAQALRQGFGFDLLERDRDLDPIRKEPQFLQLVEAARAVQLKSRDK